MFRSSLFSTMPSVVLSQYFSSTHQTDTLNNVVAILIDFWTESISEENTFTVILKDKEILS